MSDTDQGGCPCGCSRREFLGAVTVAAAGLAMETAGLTAAAGEQPAPNKQPALVRGAFIYPPSERLRGKGQWWSWPGNDFDAEGRQKKYMERIAQMEKDLAMRIVMDAKPLDAASDLGAFIADVNAAKPDGLLLIPFHHAAFGHVDRILKEAAFPTVIFSSLGVKHGPVKPYMRSGIYFIQSLDNLDAVEYGMRMIRTWRAMRESRILNLGGSRPVKDSVVAGLGTAVRTVPIQAFVDAFGKVPVETAVKELAAAFIKNAKQRLEPADEAVLAAARAYFALKNLMEAHQADAVTLDCLRRGELMPCMGVMTLRDQGIAAGCENDVTATLTLMLVQHLFDRPGFQHNPAFETEANHYFASHCTSGSKLMGIHGPQEPYLLRSFAHTNDPTCVPQILWREGADVTLAHLVPGEKPSLLVYSGKVVKSHAMPPVGGCRTNVEITINEVEDVCDVQGHHNVLFYGDYARKLRQFARLYGLRLVPDSTRGGGTSVPGLPTREDA